MLKARLTTLIATAPFARSIRRLHQAWRRVYDDKTSAFTAAAPWFDTLTLNPQAFDTIGRRSQPNICAEDLPQLENVVEPTPTASPVGAARSLSDPADVLKAL